LEIKKKKENAMEAQFHVNGETYKPISTSGIKNTFFAKL
jgi:hypothetical protein